MSGAHPQPGYGWSYGLTLEQAARVRAVMKAHGDPYRARSARTDAGQEGPLRGWSILRTPSVGSPPTEVRARYRGIDGRLLVDVDCS